MFSDYKSIRRAYTPPVTPIGGRRPRPISGSDSDVRVKMNFSPSGILQNFALPRPFRRRNKSRVIYLFHNPPPFFLIILASNESLLTAC